MARTRVPPSSGTRGLGINSRFLLLQESKVEFTITITFGPYGCWPDFSLGPYFGINPAQKVENPLIEKKNVCQFNMIFEYSLISLDINDAVQERLYYSLGRLMCTRSGRCTPVHWGSQLVHLNWPHRDTLNYTGFLGQPQSEWSGPWIDCTSIRMNFKPMKFVRPGWRWDRWSWCIPNLVVI